MNLHQATFAFPQEKVIIKHIIADDCDWYESLSNDKLKFCSCEAVISYMKECFGLSDKTIRKTLDNIVEEDRSSLPF